MTGPAIIIEPHPMGWRAAWQVADTAERREIQQVLGRSIDPMTPTQIAEALGKSRQNIQNMLGKMLDDGKVEQLTRGHYTLVSPVSPVAPEAPIETKETRDTTIPRARDGSILAPGETGDEPVPGWAS